MTGTDRSNRAAARINVKVLVILVAVVLVIGIGGVAGHYVRKRIMANASLKEGRAFAQRGEWKDACNKLLFYLRKYPTDGQVLQEWVDANLLVRPREVAHVISAITGYKDILRDHRPGDPEILGELARLYFLVKEYDEIEHICQQWLDAHPDDPGAVVWNAKALFGRREFAEAEAQLVSLVEDEEVTADVEAYRLLSAIALQDRSQAGIERAMELLNDCVRLHPDSAKAYVLRSHVLGRSGEGHESAAVADLEKAEELGTNDPHVQVALCEEWMRFNRFDRVESILRDLENVAPEVLVEYDVEPAVLDSARFTWTGKLALGRGETRGLGDLADRALSELKSPQREAFLVTAVQLYLADDRLEDAADKLDAYGQILDQSAGAGTTAEGFQVLRARLAMAGNRPYEVLNALKDTAIRGPDDPSVYLLVAWAYQETGQSTRALECFGKYVQRVPNDAGAKLKLGRAHGMLSEWDEALALAIAAEDIEPTAEARLLRIAAKLQLAKNTPDQSQVIDACRKELAVIREEEPDKAEVYELLATADSLEGNFDEAVAHLDKAIGISANPLSAELMLAELYRRRQMWKEAVVVCQGAVIRHPRSVKPSSLLADIMVDAGHTDEAIATLEKAAERLSGAEGIQAENDLVRRLLEADRRPEAFEMMERLQDSRPEEMAIRVWLLSMIEVRQDAEKVQGIVDDIRRIEEDVLAIEEDDCLRWQVEQVMLWLEQLSEVELESRREQIVEMLSRCLGVSKTWQKPVVALGVLYERLGRLEQAEEIYRRALADNPRALMVADRLLRVLQQQGKYADAAQCLEALPGTPGGFGRHRLGIALGQGEYKQAISELRRQIAANPADVRSKTLLARLVYEETKNVDQALELLDEAQQIDPNARVVVASKAAVLTAAGRTAEVLSLLDEEVERRDDLVAYFLRARYRDAMGNSEQAEEDYQHLTTFKENGAAGHDLLARFLYDKDRLDEAVAAWEAGLEIDPVNVGIRRALAHVLVNHSQPWRRERGRELLAGLLNDFPDDPDLLMVKVDSLLVLQSVPAQREAERLLLQVIELRPRKVAVWRKLIVLARSRGDLETARSLVSQALAVNPTSVELMLTRVGIESELGNDNVAHELALAVKAQYPDRIEPYLFLVELGLRLGDFTSVVEYINKISEMAPTAVGVQIARSRVLLAQRRPQLAIDNLVLYVDEEGGGEEIEALLMLTNMHLELGEISSAQKRLQQAEAVDPTRFDVVVARLNWLAKQGLFEQVYSAAEALPEEQSQRGRILLSAAHLLTLSDSREHLVKSLSLMERVVEMDPTSVRGYLAIARLSYALGDREAMTQAYRNVLEIQDDQPEALNDLAWLLAEGGDPDALAEAEQLATRGTQRYPKNYNVRDTRGVVLFKLGRLTEARSELVRCLDLVPPNAPTHARALWHLAQVLEKMGETANARMRLEKALELHEKSEVFSDEDMVEIDQMLKSL